MNELKPVATILGKGFVSSEDVTSLLSLPEGTNLYAIPDTHRVVSVEFLQLLRSLSVANGHENTARQLRTIIDSKGEESNDSV